MSKNIDNNCSEDCYDINSIKTHKIVNQNNTSNKFLDIIGNPKNEKIKHICSHCNKEYLYQ